MLPKAHTLPKQEIQEVVRYGKKAASDDIFLRYRKTSGVTRIAVIVSTKIDKRATQRNRMRRLIHQSTQNLIDRIAPADIVFVVRSNIAALKQQEVERILEGVLKNEHLI